MRTLSESFLLGDKTRFLTNWTGATTGAAAAAAQARSSVVTSLDGGQWLLAPDAKNVGRAQKWLRARSTPRKVMAPAY